MSSPPTESTVSLAVQILILVLLGYSYVLSRRKRYKIHAYVTTLALLLHIAVVGYVMIPVIIYGYGAYARFYSTFYVANLTIHAISGALTILAGSFLTLRWVLKNYDVRSCLKKTQMRIVLILWVLSIVTGIVVYISWFVTP